MSLEMIVGAVAADMFVVGDVRDLLIQAWRLVTEGEADPVIVALSAVGLATTLAPEIDWAPSVLKVARKLGTLGEEMGRGLSRLAKAKDVKGLRAVLGDTAALARGASPGGAVRLMRLAKEPGDLARMARFVERTGARGAAALHATGEAGAGLLRTADELRAAGRPAEAARAEGVLLKAAAKGPAGAAWLARGGARALLRPHWLVGALKGVYKGHASALVERALDRLGPHAWWVTGVLAAWAVLESGLFLRRFTRSPGEPLQAARPRGIVRAAA
jgi:hypothetical protein